MPRMKNTNIKSSNMGANAKRLLKFVFTNYKWQLALVVVCIMISAIASVSGSIFMKGIIDDCINPVIETIAPGADTNAAFNLAWPKLLKYLLVMISVYTFGILAAFLQSRTMAIITQTCLCDIRKEMFSKMQNLPIKYFDNNTHGDIMSYYTNDVDAIRQLIAQSLPQILNSTMIVTALLFVMLSFSVWLTLVIFVGVIAMFFITTKIGGNSAKYFVLRQKSLGKTEGFIEEMMHGQKVVKVFCHEEETIKDFNKVNDQLYVDEKKAHTFANIMMPMMGNLGNILYVLLALVGSILVISNVPNVSLSGIGKLSIGTVAAFLGIARQFTHNIANTAQQMNSIVMGLAGADRVFSLIDQEEEHDEGYVSLVYAKYDENNNLVESDTRTGIWAWKHPHSADGSITYKLLEGKVELFDVDFGYTEDKIVLHEVSLYAKPGQKIAFVGATGAGKTTITNLLNRFYDIADGKIRYDDININKIKKKDLRRALGIVLQDTNLFTGTVKDNIRYGKLDATDEEIIQAAKIANAHDFITRLPQGYDTMLTSDGANLSQGQRQLLSIARAAVSNAPVMIMDEATSSIDTRTEALVQKGTNQLMHGRTVFVIAHRLSTIQNSDVIMVLDKGRIIERGNHDELIKQQGKYYQLYTGAFELE